MRKSLWLFSFTLGAPVIIISSFFLLSYNHSSPSISPQNTLPILSYHTSTEENTFAPSFSINARGEDARPLLIQKYLKHYSSSLEPYSQIIVNISDKYSLDYRLLVAIAQQESNLCKKIPDNSYNCWGFGIYGDKVTRFDNFPQAMEAVAKTLKRNYIEKGLDTPEKIMAKYTPPSVEKGGPWAKGVSMFLEELE
jgi:hypothetical protein